MDKRAIEKEFGLVKFISDKVIENANGVKYFIKQAIMLSENSHYISYRMI